MTSASAFSIHTRPQPPISNARLGTMLLVGSLTVLFTCFISAYMILRMATPVWPPYGAPQLTLGLSALNTAVLLASSVVVFIGGRKKNFVLAAWILGILFLGLQGWEFERLYARGLTLQTGAYGAVFYTLIGCHGVHVLGGLLGFLWALQKPERIDTARLYWYFVSAVWLVLFSILYIV